MEPTLLAQVATGNPIPVHTVSAPAECAALRNGGELMLKKFNSEPLPASAISNGVTNHSATPLECDPLENGSETLKKLNEAAPLECDPLGGDMLKKFNKADMLKNYVYNYKLLEHVTNGKL